MAGIMTEEQLARTQKNLDGARQVLTQGWHSETGPDQRELVGAVVDLVHLVSHLHEESKRQHSAMSALLTHEARAPGLREQQLDSRDEQVADLTRKLQYVVDILCERDDWPDQFVIFPDGSRWDSTEEG